MGWSKWIDLKLPRATDGMSMPFDAAVPTQDSYPYGMRISMNETTLKALDLDISEVTRGTQIDIRAFGEVCAIHDNGTISVQLCRIKVENEDAEDQED